MLFTVTNLTTQAIAFLEKSKSPETTNLYPTVVRAQSVGQITLTKCTSRILLASWETSETAKEQGWDINANNISIKATLALGVSWQPIKVPADCLWRIYCSKISQKHHRLLIFARRDLSAFLSEMSDSLPLSSLLLPGTHDTMAFYGWPVSQCQSLSTPLDMQLRSGIRAIDIRLAVVDGRLIAYHGVYPQRTPFQEILSTIHNFLTSQSSSRETIVMSIKQEDYNTTPLQTFSDLVHQEIFNGPGGRDMWFFENRIPSLGEVRGKVILFSRFGGNGTGWEGGLEGLGIHPSTWPDSEKSGFSWQCKNTLVRTHDWYSIPSFLSIPEKVSLATQTLLPAVNNPPMPVLSVAFFSAASFPFAFPPTIAQGFGWPKWGLGVEGVNSRLGKWLLDIMGGDEDAQASNEEKKVDGSHVGTAIRGWVFLDYFAEPENAVVPLLVECNFRGRSINEAGAS